MSDPLPLNQVDPAVSDVLMERIQKESAKHEMSRTVYKGALLLPGLLVIAIMGSVLGLGGTWAREGVSV